ncbi:MAG TPA: hypothetical protein VMO47_10495 [Rhodothermales bacterium]|nr:hypothetical protein [Rhodothermales bacterium]
MANVCDIRIAIGWSRHPKLRRARRLLESRDGYGARDYIENLWHHVAEHWPATGEFRGMDAYEIADAAEYRGDAEEFVRVLHDDCRLLDCGTDCVNSGADRCSPDHYRCHDWQDHQPWAIGSEERQAIARQNAHKAHCKGPSECDRDYCPNRKQPAQPEQSKPEADGSAPIPIPIPIPTLKDKMADSDESVSLDPLIRDLVDGYDELRDEWFGGAGKHRPETIKKMEPRLLRVIGDLSRQTDGGFSVEEFYRRFREQGHFFTRTWSGWSLDSLATRPNHGTLTLAEKIWFRAYRNEESSVGTGPGGSRDGRFDEVDRQCGVA